jgi:two-component system, OmpR family, sensor histidine kinase VicK
VKFAKEEGGEGTMTIITEKKHSHAGVKVNDTDTGIDSEILPQLFSKFTSKSYQANGLGLLFIVKIIIEFHSGKNWVENNNINTHREKGDTFYVTLPIIDQRLNVKTMVNQ